MRYEGCPLSNGKEPLLLLSVGSVRVSASFWIVGKQEFKKFAFVGKTPKDRRHGSLAAVARSSPVNSDLAQEHRPSCVAAANRNAGREIVRSRYVDRCPDVTNYPAARLSLISA
jgi:hypothetical protein